MMPTSLKDTDNGQVSNSSRKLLFPTTSDNAAQGGVWLNSAEQSPTPLSLTIRQDHVHMHIEYPPSKSISSNSKFGMFILHRQKCRNMYVSRFSFSVNITQSFL